MTDQKIVLPPRKAESPLATLVFNIAIPAFVLMKMSGNDRLGPTYGLMVALAFPLVYAVWDFSQRRTISFIAAIGFLAILAKGSLGLLQLNHFWFAVNEAAVPALIAIALWISDVIGRPLVRSFLMNDAVMNVDRIQQAIKERQQEDAFATALQQSTWLLILSFVISAILNFGLAWWMLKSPVGSEKFNEEMGYMTAVSMPVILLCSSSVMFYALWKLLKQITQMTGLAMEDIFKK